MDMNWIPFTPGWRRVRQEREKNRIDYLVNRCISAIHANDRNEAWEWRFVKDMPLTSEQRRKIEEAETTARDRRMDQHRKDVAREYERRADDRARLKAKIAVIRENLGPDAGPDAVVEEVIRRLRASNALGKMDDFNLTGTLNRYDSIAKDLGG